MQSRTRPQLLLALAVGGVATLLTLVPDRDPSALWASGVAWAGVAPIIAAPPRTSARWLLLATAAILIIVMGVATGRSGLALAAGAAAVAGLVTPATRAAGPRIRSFQLYPRASLGRTVAACRAARSWAQRRPDQSSLSFSLASVLLVSAAVAALANQVRVVQVLVSLAYAMVAAQVFISPFRPVRLKVAKHRRKVKATTLATQHPEP